MKRIILLGASGFLGTALLQKLKKENFVIKVLIHNQEIQSTYAFRGDVTQEGMLDEHISDNDIIVNLTGQYAGATSEFFDQNVKGGFNILNAALKKRNVRIILASSIAVYGNCSNNPPKEDNPTLPQSSYGIVKLLTEKLYSLHSELFGLNVTILRFSNVYGPNKKVGIIANCMKSIKNNSNIVIHHSGNQIRDFLFIDDAIEGLISSIKNPMNRFSIFNISSGMGTQITDLLNQIELITGNKIPITLNSQKIDEEIIWANNSNAKKYLQFEPKTSLIEGLNLTLR